MEKLSFNGINGATGEYLLPEMSADDLANIVTGEDVDQDHLQELLHRHRDSLDFHLGVRAGVDPTRIEEAGWGVVFAFSDGDEVNNLMEALAPLLQHRREQAGDLYREFVGSDAYRSGESKRKFLARFGSSPGQPADPQKVPYYLLIVASPEAIPFRFQYQVDIEHAVGRIHFDTLDEYANYAKSVVAAEKGETKRKKSAAFFGVRNIADRATQLSAKELVKPLADSTKASNPEWEVTTRIKDEAKKADLTSILDSAEGPALLFTASHGMGFPKDHELQVAHQGALLCQDWKGPGNKPSAETDYFSGDDLTSGSKVAGLVAFHFACYGAGTPQKDDFAHRAGVRLDIAQAPFVAQLPKKLLSHPNGGALACVGHVERAWGYSFMAPGAGAQLEVFRSTLQQLLEGHPIGAAMEFFDERYAALAAELTSELENINFGAEPDKSELAGMWTSQNDARSYIILGDPAVRLAVE